MKNAMRVSYLDGLRGWAALIVCVYHTASLFGYKNATAPLSNFLIFIQNKYFNLIFDGNLSVRIFFILSGIVLSISFIKNPDLKKLAALLIKRIPRLSIPIFAMSLISHFLVKSGLMFNVAANEILGYYGLLPFHYKLDSTLFNVFESSFLLPFFSYANSSGEYANAAWANTMLYSNVLWTMPHEMIGSIFVAVALFLASFINKSKRIIAITIAFVGLIILAYQNALFAGTLICFLFGILLAYYLINRHKTTPPPPYSIGYKILLAMIILWLYYNDFTLDMKRNLIAILIIFLVIISPYLQKILSNKISIFLGKISFPLYLIHMTVICSLTSSLIVKRYDPNNTALVLAYCAISIGVSIAAACILYPVEKFAVAFSHKVFEYFCGDKKIEFIRIKDFIEKVRNNIKALINNKKI